MTTFLYSLLTAGSDRMAITDPHGFMLTIVSVSVVFLGLIILFCVYTLSGAIFSGRFSRKKADAKPAEAQAGASSDTDMAAVAAAVGMYLSDTLHDDETSIITISRQTSPWADKSLTMRRSLR